MFKVLKRSSKASRTIWRQGDVFVIATGELPRLGRTVRRPILAEGEVTGHAHRIEDPTSAHVFSIGQNLYLEVVAPSATVVHEEHRPLSLPRGEYEIRIQREYS